MLASQTPGCNVAEITLLGWGWGAERGIGSSHPSHCFRQKGNLPLNFLSLAYPVHQLLCISTEFFVNPDSAIYFCVCLKLRLFSWGI